MPCNLERRIMICTVSHICLGEEWFFFGLQLMKLRFGGAQFGNYCSLSTTADSLNDLIYDSQSELLGLQSFLIKGSILGSICSRIWLHRISKCMVHSDSLAQRRVSELKESDIPAERWAIDCHGRLSSSYTASSDNYFLEYSNCWLGILPYFSWKYLYYSSLI